MSITILFISILGVCVGIYYGDNANKSSEREKIEYEYSDTKSSFRLYQEGLNRYDSLLVSKRHTLEKKLNQNKCPTHLTACHDEIDSYNLALDIFSSQGEKQTCNYLSKIGYFKQHQEEQYLFSSSSFTFSVTEINDSFNSFKALKVNYLENRLLKEKWMKLLTKRRRELLALTDALLEKAKKYSRAKSTIDKYLLHCETSLQNCTQKSNKLYLKIQDLISYNQLECNSKKLIH